MLLVQSEAVALVLESFILAVMTIVVVLNSILDRAEEYILRWRPKESDSAEP